MDSDCRLRRLSSIPFGIVPFNLLPPRSELFDNLNASKTPRPPHPSHPFGMSLALSRFIFVEVRGMQQQVLALGKWSKTDKAWKMVVALRRPDSADRSGSRTDDRGPARRPDAGPERR